MVTNPTLVASMKTVLEHIRRKDAGDGTLEKMTPEEASKIATYFFNRYKDEVGMRDVVEPDNKQLAQCIFQKFRGMLTEAKFHEINLAQVKAYQTSLEVANTAAKSEIANELGDSESLKEE